MGTIFRMRIWFFTGNWLADTSVEVLDRHIQQINQRKKNILSRLYIGQVWCLPNIYFAAKIWAAARNYNFILAVIYATSGPGKIRTKKSLSQHKHEQTKALALDGLHYVTWKVLLLSGSQTPVRPFPPSQKTIRKAISRRCGRRSIFTSLRRHLRETLRLDWREFL